MNKSNPLKIGLATLCVAAAIVLTPFGTQTAEGALGLYDVQYSNAVYYWDLGSYYYSVGYYAAGDYYYYGYGMPYYYAHLTGYYADYWSYYGNLGSLRSIFESRVLNYTDAAHYYWVHY